MAPDASSWAGGPCIYIHPHTAGIPTIALLMVQDVLALRQEEEESGSSDEDNAQQLPQHEDMIRAAIAMPEEVHEWVSYSDDDE